MKKIIEKLGRLARNAINWVGRDRQRGDKEVFGLMDAARQARYEVAAGPRHITACRRYGAPRSNAATTVAVLEERRARRCWRCPSLGDSTRLEGLAEALVRLRCGPRGGPAGDGGRREG